MPNRILREVDVSMSKRQGISKKIRFEVFKRDSFKCQYCGKSSPDVVLHVDHISPVSKGGENDLLNLITSCVDCNLGKSDKALDDDSVLAKQREQLAALNERREQLEMMLEWRDGLQKIDDVALEKTHEAWQKIVPGFSLNETGTRKLKELLRKHGIEAVLNAIKVAESYVRFDKDGNALHESVEVAFKKLGAVSRVNAEPEWRRELYYIRGILRNRAYTYLPAWKVLQLLEDAVNVGIDVDIIKRMALDCRNWNQFEDWIRDAMDEAEK